MYSDWLGIYWTLDTCKHKSVPAQLSDWLSQPGRMVGYRLGYQEDGRQGDVLVFSTIFGVGFRISDSIWGCVGLILAFWCLKFSFQTSSCKVMNHIHFVYAFFWIEFPEMIQFLAPLANFQSSNGWKIAENGSFQKTPTVLWETNPFQTWCIHLLDEISEILWFWSMMVINFDLLIASADKKWMQLGGTHHYLEALLLNSFQTWYVQRVFRIYQIFS